MAMGGMGRIGRIIKDAGRLASKKRKPPKKFDAMTEGRKVSQAKKKIEAKKKRDKKFSDIGKFMVATLEGSQGERSPSVKPKTKFKDRLDYDVSKRKPGIGSSNPDKKSNIAKGSRLADPKRNRKAPKPSQLGGRSRKMGGGKIYASTDKKYGGGIFPRKGKM